VSEPTITVCSACLTAACWHGRFYCEAYRTAGTVEKTEAELRALERESPDNWLDGETP
jgi:hypothetical protein